jgi:thiol:disulfide interchange protein DsbC
MDDAMKTIRNAALAAAVAFGVVLGAGAQDLDKIRKTLGERVPQMGKIDEVSKTPMPGLYEVRVGTDLFYSDAEGNFLIQGFLMDTKQQRNLTEERQDKLLTIPFDKLPLKDAFMIMRGNGKRRIAIFEDPNCPYCKHFEQDLQKVKDVTVYLFLYPILGPDSNDKSRNLWCSKDRAGAWLDWMLRGKAAPEATCDIAAVNRNVELGRKYKISGTPTMVLEDGRRIPGALPASEVEKLLAEQK